MKKMLFCLLALIPSFLMAVDVNVFLVGTGVVGGALLEQMKVQGDALRDRYGVNIHVVGIANSRAMQVNFAGIDLNHWRTSQNPLPMSWEDYLNLIQNSELPNLIFVDCTSNQEIADSYPTLLQSGISVVTPNKKANSGSFASYQNLRDAAAEGNAKFSYDSNVGAGLPILSTIDALLKSGDELIKVDAILSGTLSYIFNSFGSNTRFSDIVREAQKKGYTEPDPRDDLNGMDFARKLLILGREAGYSLEMEEIALDSILPADCFEPTTVAEFYEKLASYDYLFTQKRVQADAEGKRLLYIGTLENGKAMILLQPVGQDHPFYFLSGNDNIAALTTRYYCKNPLVIQGPGAGADVTAARVLEGIVTTSLGFSNSR